MQDVDSQLTLNIKAPLICGVILIIFMDYKTDVIA